MTYLKETIILQIKNVYFQICLNQPVYGLDRKKCTNCAIKKKSYPSIVSPLKAVTLNFFIFLIITNMSIIFAN